MAHGLHVIFTGSADGFHGGLIGWQDDRAARQRRRHEQADG